MENVDKSSRSIFVGNIPYEATEEDLKAEFSKAGPVVGFRLVRDKDTNSSKGFGFCEFSSNEIAASALRNLTNMQFRGRALRIGSAIGEQNNVDIAISNSFSLVKHPVETPYGETVDPHEVIPNINSAVSSIPPEQLYDLMTEMKVFIQCNPNEARQLLIENPQLTYALLQAQMSMRVIEPNVAIGMMMQNNDQTIDNNMSIRNKNKNIDQHPYFVNGNNEHQGLNPNVNPHGNQQMPNIRPNVNQGLIQNVYPNENNILPGHMPQIINGFHAGQGQMLPNMQSMHEGHDQQSQIPPHIHDVRQERGPMLDIHQGRGPMPDIHQGRGPMPDIHQGRGPMPDIHHGRGPMPDIHQGRGPMPDIHQGRGPMPDIHQNRGLMPDIHQSRGPMPDIHPGRGPMPDIHHGRGPMPDIHQGREPMSDIHQGRGPMPDIHQGRGPMPDIAQGRGPMPDITQGRGPMLDIHQGRGPMPDIHQGRGPMPDIHQGRGNMPDNHSDERNFHPREMEDNNSTENQFNRGQIPQSMRNVHPQHYNGQPPTFQKPFEFQR